MRIIKNIVGIVILCIVSVVALGQKKYVLPDTKEIIINSKDSIVRSNILLVSEKMSVDNSLFYYWYNSDNIYVNRGGFAGNLLHGKYLVFDMDEKLKAEGYFDKGLKEGVWKKWHNNGELASIEEWENGNRNGLQKYFDSQGNVIKYINFKKGLLHGDFVTYDNGTTLKKEFKDGEEVIKRDKEKKKIEKQDQIENDESDNEKDRVKIFQRKNRKLTRESKEDDIAKDVPEEKINSEEKENKFLNKLFFWKTEKDSNENIDQKSDKEEKKKKERKSLFKKKKDAEL